MPQPFVCKAIFRTRWDIFTHLIQTEFNVLKIIIICAKIKDYGLQDYIVEILIYVFDILFCCRKLIFQRGRERSFTLSPIRDGGYQPQGFSRTTRGFVNIPPDHVDKYLIDARDLKKRRLVNICLLALLLRYKEI